MTTATRNQPPGDGGEFIWQAIYSVLKPDDVTAFQALYIDDPPDAIRVLTDREADELVQTLEQHRADFPECGPVDRQFEAAQDWVRDVRREVA
jgi:hypothetical protein